MKERRVWTEDKLNEAARLWDDGLTAAKIAETLGVTLGSFLGTSSQRRDQFPMRVKPAEKAVEAVPVIAAPKLALVVPEPPRRTYIAGQWVEHVKRTTSSGAVVTLPRVSFIDGVRESG